MKSTLPWWLSGLVALSAQAGADWRALAARLPMAVAVVEDSSQSFELRADGKFTATIRYRATILREPGIAPLSKYSDSYYEKYDQMRVKRAVVTGPDGQVTEVGRDAIKDLPMPADGPVYLPNMRLVLISFPRLEVGCTVEVETEAVREAPPMDGAFSLLEPLQGELPRLRQSFTVTLPAAMPLSWRVYRGAARFTRETRNGRATCRWEVGEQPQVVLEPSMPAYEEVSPVLAVSTIHGWREVSRWYAGLCRDGQALTPALAGLVAEVTAGRRTQEDRIRALFLWTTRHIRYVETTYTGAKAGFKPASAEQTYERKYGVCRDKAQLLVTLLRAIGEDAHMVLINIGARLEVAVPGIEFDHAIAAIREADGSFRFLDPTAEDSRQYLPGSDQDHYALVCTAQGEDIQATPLAPPAENRMDIALDTVLGADGSLAARVRLTPTGICEEDLRERLRGLPPAQREMFFSTGIGREFPGAVVRDLRLPDLDDLEAPLRVSFTLAVPRQGIRSGNQLVFTTLGQGGKLDLVLADLLPEDLAPQRRHPLVLDATLESRIRETVRLPPGYRVRALPGPVALKAEASGLERTCRTGPEGLLYAEDFSASARYYSGASYRGLRRALERRGRLRDGKVILFRRGGER
jgi:hypothetical protein